MWRIQAMARHSSTAILRYLDDSHHSRLQDIAAEAALSNRLEELQHQVDALQAAGQPHLPLPAAPPEALPIELAPQDLLTEPPRQTLFTAAPGDTALCLPFVISTHRTGRAHKRDPSNPSFALCGWAWAASGAYRLSVDPFGPEPSLAVPYCRACSSKEAHAEEDALSDSGSDA